MRCPAPGHGRIVRAMGIRRTAASWAGNEVARRGAPQLASRGAHQFISKAIDGFPGFPSAQEVARRRLSRRRDVDRAIRDVVETHLRLAGVQGFVTNLGGVIAMPVAIPANIAGIAALQLRMVASILYLRGYDIDDPKTRTAALLTLLGPDAVKKGVKDGSLDGTPYDIAVSMTDLHPGRTEQIASRVMTEFMGRIGGKHATLALAKRVPVVGGAVSAGVDALSTYNIGRYAREEFPTRVMIERAEPTEPTPTE